MKDLTHGEFKELDELLAKAINRAFEVVVTSALTNDADTVDTLKEWSKKNGASIQQMFGIDSVEDTNKFMHDKLMEAAKRIEARL